MQSAGLKLMVEETNAARFRFQLYGYLGVGAFVVLIGLLLLKALTTVDERKRHGRDSGVGPS